MLRLLSRPPPPMSAAMPSPSKQKARRRLRKADWRSRVRLEILMLRVPEKTAQPGHLQGTAVEPTLPSLPGAVYEQLCGPHPQIQQRAQGYQTKTDRQRDS